MTSINAVQMISQVQLEIITYFTGNTQLTFFFGLLPCCQYSAMYAMQNPDSRVAKKIQYGDPQEIGTIS